MRWTESHCIAGVWWCMRDHQLIKAIMTYILIMRLDIFYVAVIYSTTAKV
jgi:hypothetical protein